MSDPDTHTEPDPAAAIRHLAWAATPSLVGAIAVLIQLLAPYIPESHQGLLWGVAIYCGNITLAIWLWCAILRARRRNTETRRLARSVLAVVERNEKALQGVHRRLDTNSADLGRIVQRHDEALQGVHQRLDDNNAELEHIAALVINRAPITSSIPNN